MSKNNLTAVILAGGYGTRMRPFTFTQPKPLIPFLNIPLVEWQINALYENNVRKIIISLNYLSEKVEHLCDRYMKLYKDIKIFCYVESIPLGTAGCLRDIMHMVESQDFFLLNSDINCTFPFMDLLLFHRQRDCAGTILSVSVENPSQFGAMKIVGDKIIDFIEKPKHFISNKINGGIYILSKKIINFLPTQRNISIERDVFPVLAAKKLLFAFSYDDYWYDLGRPHDFLNAQKLFLHKNLLDTKNSFLLAEGSTYGKNVILKNVVIGKNVTIKDDVCLENVIIMDNCIIDDKAEINDSMIGKHVSVGECAKITDSLLGDDVIIHKNLFISDCKISPNLTISSNEKNKSIL